MMRPYLLIQKLVLVSATFLVSSAALSETKTSQHATGSTGSSILVNRPQVANACPGYSPFDPFSMNYRYKVGPRQGECFRLDEFRPIHVLTEEEAFQYAEKAQLPPPVPGELWVANIRHKDKFWVARIPVDSVEDVIFQVERFDPDGPLLAALNHKRWFAAHAQVRFKFKKGLEATLIPQFTNDHSPAEKLSNIVASSEAVRRKGEKFNPFKGNRDHYGLAKRVLSLDQVIEVSVKDLKHEIAQYPIQIPGTWEQQNQKRQDYLRSALMRSEKDYQAYRSGRPPMYNGREKNCISGAIDIFDDITNYRNLSQGDEADPEMWPREILPSLHERGLIRSTQRYQYPTLNREYGLPFR